MSSKKPLHPGVILRLNYVEPLGITVTQFAEMLGISRVVMSSILNGRAGVSADMAIKLSEVLDTRPEFWMRLSERYSLYTAQKKIGKRTLSHLKKSHELYLELSQSN